MLNYSCVNRVYYAYASVGPDGSVFVVLSLGGATCSSVFPAVAGNAHLRENLARSALGLVEASGLDGIDIAWEYPCSVEQGNDFLALLATIRLHLAEDRHILTAALPATKTVLQFIDFSLAANYLDAINLVAYDFFGMWTPISGHHSQLYAMSGEEPSGSSGVAHLMSHGFPSGRILLGIPTYGRSFQHATGPGQNFKGAGGDDGTFEYDQLPRKGCKESVDKRRISAQCVGGDGGFVTYDNPDTVKAKAAFAKQKGLGVSGLKRGFMLRARKFKPLLC
ncbi:chitinase 18-3 [Metarhizium album ARSEF 1941]|uniref:chitinase n=1 Tax=Metarhizium album (strain ARSEF 1941) TaxID=1081103 RepID=A0A0B2WT88_METAS|nr:chitinase 18-3 [Metarhizium album ARSEF 1941]KHN96854.1 chitinase 18-3 [Metarhizium album ARSEF 1941]